MKKLNANIHSDLNQDQDAQPVLDSKTKSSEFVNVDLKELPKKKIYGHDLTKMKSFKNLRKNYKQDNMKIHFITSLKPILESYIPVDSENDLNDELLVEILNMAESYFIYFDETEREELKHSSVVELMLPYFHNDEKLMEKMISMVWGRVKKSTWKRRAFSKLKLFLAKFLSISMSNI